MIIKYKTIQHERTEDAPFMGALVCADDCKFNCDGCFNQHLKELPTQYKSADDIIKEIKQNQFNQGIILAGLEWTLQPTEMKELINIALKNELQVMVYTGMTEEDFENKFYDIAILPICIKFGRYIKDLATSDNIQYGIKLATSNQTIIKKEIKNDT